MKVLRQITCMSAIAVMSAFLGACSSDNDVAGINDISLSNVRTITFTAGPLGGDAETRVAFTDEDNTIKSAWEVDDVVGVSYTNEKGKQFVEGTVTAVTDGVATISAKIEGTLENGSSFDVNYPALTNDKFTKEYLPNLLTKQKGTLEDIQDNWAYFNGAGTVSGNAAPTEISMKSRSAIWRLTFASQMIDFTRDITELTIEWKDGENSIEYTVKPPSTSAIYVCLSNFYTPLKNNGNITITAKTSGDKTYVVTKTIAKDFSWGEFYQSTILVTDLSTVTSAYQAHDGETLTGTLGSNVKISIEPNATVALTDVTINGTDKDSYKWAGITCEGDATIILNGENTVTGFYCDYPGIYVPKNNTLTIKGGGSLNASCNNPSEKGYGAGIGAAYAQNLPCGNIWILGGTITATGGRYAAGIGGCDGIDVCGDITIEGGTITAIGGEDAAGIGSGRGTSTSRSSCGDITITSDVTSVTAYKGTGATYCIGASNEFSTNGTITIGGVVKTDQSEFVTSPYIFPAP